MGEQGEFGESGEIVDWEEIVEKEGNLWREKTKCGGNVTVWRKLESFEKSGRAKKEHEEFGKSKKGELGVSM